MNIYGLCFQELGLKDWGAIFKRIYLQIQLEDWEGLLR